MISSMLDFEVNVVFKEVDNTASGEEENPLYIAKEQSPDNN